MTIFLKFIIILLLLLLLLLLFLKSKTQVKEVCLVIMTSLFQGSIALPGFPSEETSQKSRWGLVKKKKTCNCFPDNLGRCSSLARSFTYLRDRGPTKG